MKGKRLAQFVISWSSLALALALAGCGSREESAEHASVPPHIAVPANEHDVQAWRDYMGKVADPVSGTVRPFKFLVPSGSDPFTASQREQLKGALGVMAKGNSFPGAVIAIGGPDPSGSADVLVSAFGQAKQGSLTSTTVLYVGNSANRARVEKVVVASGAKFRFSEM